MTYIPKTNLEIQINFIVASINYFINYKLNHLSLQLLSLLLGFFISTALSTIPAQTGDWGIIAAAIIVTNQEIVSKIIYQKKLRSYCQSIFLLRMFLRYCNSIKIGILYGLFVDAFKLGS
jgi:hypothetical protein|uniref:Uncharacterized protein ycf20 n=3 Tax=Corallina TaxID=35169 RepID=A0A6M3WCW8_COROI|nr:conserved hypothetical plastid protein [Corallina ferreyrae]YP_009660685.1 conserved hypothetical plastid protein [Corallina chilensis]QJF58358.1 hypothetical protein [Corallina officinalis]QBL75733.1 conserved hypothetical plastid protein [Corallina ferreyrae]QCS25633.1 conserved hypothetical plastid protein [Corallina chilensis]QJF58557.1 hypothetical protein [Corallina officinalis]QJF58756.1 hypothetical protein [Corallina officinalis]